MHLEEPAVSDLWPENVVAAERALVSLCLVGDPVVQSCNLGPKHFFSVKHAAVWAAAAKLYESGSAVELIPIADQLAKEGRLDSIGGFAWLSGFLGRNMGVGSLADSYAEIVRTAHAGRELRRVVSEVPRALAEGASVYEVADRLRNFVDRIESSEVDCVSLETECSAEVDRIAADLKRISEGKAPESGLPTGLGLDEAVPGGIPRDRLTIIFGETGTYKTAVKQWVSDAIAASGRYVLDFSLEDSAELTAQRFLARHTGIPYGRIAARELSDAETAAVGNLTDVAQAVAARTIVVGNVPATIDEAIRLSRHWARKVPLAAVFLDYIQIMDQGTDENEAKALYKICLQAQRAAKRDRLAWVLVSQMNRKYANRDDKRPVLADLYGSSGIQQTAKLIMGIYRPANHEQAPAKDSPWYNYYVNNPNGPDAYKGALELWVRKNVVGETNIFVPLHVDRATGRMSTLRTEDMQ